MTTVQNNQKYTQLFEIFQKQSVYMYVHQTSYRNMNLRTRVSVLNDENASNLCDLQHKDPIP